MTSRPALEAEVASAMRSLLVHMARVVFSDVTNIEAHLVITADNDPAIDTLTWLGREKEAR